jgi:hypothetical protein
VFKVNNDKRRTDFPVDEDLTLYEGQKGDWAPKNEGESQANQADDGYDLRDPKRLNTY